MSIEIKDLGEDRFELIEIKPRSLGILTDRQTANHFAAYLNTLNEAQEQPSLPSFLRAGGDDLPVDEVPEAAMPEPAHEEAAAEAAPEASPDAEEAPSLTVAAIEDDLFAEAITRVASGENVGVVADELGLSFPRLRGKWAKHVRDQNEAEENTASKADGCRTCGREFKDTTGNGTCARCSRDLGVA